MIKRIIAFMFLFCLMVAIPLAIAGITRVELGGSFLALMKNTSLELNKFKVAIPSIPSIPALEKTDGFMAVVNVLVQFINGFINILNFLVTILNYVIQLIEFLVLLIKNLITFRESLGQSTDNFPYLPNLPYD